MQLSLVPGSFAVCRLAPQDEIPAWVVRKGNLLSITYTADELSIVCPAACVPANVKAERGWAALKVAGPLDFALVGIMSALAVPLAQAGISIFAVSTFDTDYLLLKEQQLAQACQVLEVAGHKFI